MATVPNSHASVVVVGSANVDLVATTPRHPLPGETLIGSDFHEYPGGKGLNQAVASARAGARTAFICAVGDDDAGRFLHSIASGESLDLTGIHISPDEPTGRALIVVDHLGENSIIVVPGSNAACPPATNIGPSDVVLAQLEIPISAVTDSFIAARKAGAMTILNPAPAAELSAELLSLCDIVIPNEHEIELLGGVSRLQEAGVKTVIVTKGAAGIDIYHEGVREQLPSFRVTPVDTTGAGDAFCGSLAASLAAGHELNDACLRALAG
ncbi:MAG: ribokinase, partial [Ilumatobacteraceae bacterium]